MLGKYFVLLVTIGVAAAIQKVQVDIYYETLCSDSMTFFTKQFTPTWRDLKDYIQPQFVPYGKSTSTNLPGQNVTFNCNHGPNECIGNKFQSCLVDNVYNIKLEDQINLIDCLMTDATKEKDYIVTAEACRSKTPLVDVKLLSACAMGNDGNRLLLKNGEESNKIQNPLAFVPTIVFNRQFNADESKDAGKSFRSAVCKRITDMPKPKACEGSGAPITSAVGLITLFVSGMIVRMF